MLSSSFPTCVARQTVSIIQKIKIWAKRIKRDAVMLWFARRHADTPVLAKVICVFTVAYALSPIDLIPDFIPVLGYLDDAILLPALIWLAVRLLPEPVIQECQSEAESWMERNNEKPISYIGGAVIVAIWAAISYICWLYLFRR